MAYLKTIETSQTWVCPKDGDYKIICVAGGQGGVVNSTAGGDGGTTSFGSYLSASGYGSRGGYGGAFHGGGGGYTGYAYGGTGGVANSPNFTSGTINGGAPMTPGSGWGAGGSGTSGKGGDGGKLMTTAIHLTAGTSIACTIGIGGVGGSSDTRYAGLPGVIIIQEV